MQAPLSKMQIPPLKKIPLVNATLQKKSIIPSNAFFLFACYPPLAQTNPFQQRGYINKKESYLLLYK